MGNINLDDTKGYFRELVRENFLDFWYEYQSPKECNREKVTIVFRKMINLCLTLNHQVDKVAKNLNYSSPTELINEIKKHYSDEGKSIDSIRKFSNDVKHKSQLDQYYTTRKRTESFDDAPLDVDLPDWYYLNSDGNKVVICDCVIKAFWFWQNWLDQERPNLKSFQ